MKKLTIITLIAALLLIPDTAMARKKKTLDRVLETVVPAEIYDELEKMI